VGPKFGLDVEKKRDLLSPVTHPGFFPGGGGVQQIKSRTEGRDNGDLWALAP
jgi:hypothetical protein